MSEKSFREIKFFGRGGGGPRVPWLGTTHVNNHAGFWSEVVRYHVLSCEDSPPVVVILDVFDVEHSVEFKETVKRKIRRPAQ